MSATAAPNWERSIPRDRVWGSCLYCVHFGQGMGCPAFPDGIPVQILSGEVDHLVVRPGQVGAIVYEPIDKAIWRRTRQRVPLRSTAAQQPA